MGTRNIFCIRTYRKRIEYSIHDVFVFEKNNASLLMTYRKTLIRRIITKNVNVVINDVKKTSFMRHRDN